MPISAWILFPNCIYPQLREQFSLWKETRPPTENPRLNYGVALIESKLIYPIRHFACDSYSLYRTKEHTAKNDFLIKKKNS